MKTDVIMGAGEVGTALGEVIKKAGKSFVFEDPTIDTPLQPEEVELLHVCFPYGSEFVMAVWEAIKRFKPKHTIIHSTVEVGTTAKVASLANCKNVSYSFIRGRHPDLKDQMTSFTKHIGNPDQLYRDEASLALRELGFTTMRHDTYEAVELGKLWDTTYYGICIAATKLAKEMADHYGVSWMDIGMMNGTYNEGMRQLGTEQFVRPELTPTPGTIGGHCVVPNAEILRHTFTSPLLDAVVEAK